MNTALIRRTIEPECAATKASCICMLPATHEGAHVCECEGSWDDEGNVLAYPAVVVEDDSLFGPKGTRPFEWLDL